ncbi:hypothetical protein F5Y19DRAFT_470772 [Xylariaceae sp. FL1651]|nr:hypothetical protein F5Y19DRAFT_470772 [Xylariaceae sp. FL1651]
MAGEAYRTLVRSIRSFLGSAKGCLLRLAREKANDLPSIVSNDPEAKYGGANNFAFQLQQLRMDWYLDENLYHDIAETGGMDENNYLSKEKPKRELLRTSFKQAVIGFILWWRQFIETH